MNITLEKERKWDEECFASSIHHHISVRENAERKIEDKARSYIRTECQRASNDTHTKKMEIYLHTVSKKLCQVLTTHICLI